MRPGDLPPGNHAADAIDVARDPRGVSMRPGDLPPGNTPGSSTTTTSSSTSFNEAGGFTPRKLAHTASKRQRVSVSMRPGDLPPGNYFKPAPPLPKKKCFNEAGGFTPRKLPKRALQALQESGFNEAGGFTPRKPAPLSGALGEMLSSFNEAGGFTPRKRYRPGFINIETTFQ